MYEFFVDSKVCCLVFKCFFLKSCQVLMRADLYAGQQVWMVRTVFLSVQCSVTWKGIAFFKLTLPNVSFSNIRETEAKCFPGNILALGS